MKTNFSGENQVRGQSIDLHSHSTASDGKLSPNQLLELAQSYNLYAYSITDHDVVDAYVGLDISKFGGLLIPGTELHCRFEGMEIEVLGYGINIAEMGNKDSIAFYKTQKSPEWRKNLLERLKAVGHKQGLTFDNDLEPDPVLNPHDVFCDNVWKKYNAENKEKLLNIGVDGRGTFWRKHIQNPQSLFHLPEMLAKHDLRQVCADIHDAGGYAILAHPYGYLNPNFKQVNGMALVKDAFAENYGLDGIEVMHSGHNGQNIKDLREFAKAKKIMTTGGSDYHAVGKQVFAIGRQDRKQPIPKSLAIVLLERLVKENKILHR